MGKVRMRTQATEFSLLVCLLSYIYVGISSPYYPSKTSLLVQGGGVSREVRIPTLANIHSS